MREILLGSDDISAEVEGINELVDRIPILTKIHIHYTLRIPPGSREIVDRTLERHVSKCPSAKSLEGAVKVTWSADIEQLG